MNDQDRISSSSQYNINQISDEKKKINLEIIK